MISWYATIAAPSMDCQFLREGALEEGIAMARSWGGIRAIEPELLADSIFSFGHSITLGAD